MKLPPGYFISWGGQFENQQRAMKRFAIVVPITIAAIFLLLFSSFNSVKQATLIILNIPFAMIGGIVALVVGNFNLSVSASVGFIALFGVAVLNGIVMVSYFNELRREGLAGGSRRHSRRRLAAATRAHHRERRGTWLDPDALCDWPWKRNPKTARRRRHWRADHFNPLDAFYSADAFQCLRAQVATRFGVQLPEPPSTMELATA